MADGSGTPDPGRPGSGARDGDGGRARRPTMGGDELGRLLARLGAPPEAPDPAGPRVLAAVPPLGPLSGLLEEIDGTVMARCLVLRNAAGAELHLEACNRRLLTVSRPDAAAGTRPAGTNLTYAGRADLLDLRQTLSEFCAAGRVTVRTAPPAGPATLDQTGVAVATLHQAWTEGTGQTSPRPAVPALPLPALIAMAEAEGLILAGAWSDGAAAGGLATAGAPDDAAALAALLPDVATAEPIGGQPDRGLTIFEAAGQAPVALLRDGAARAILRLAPGRAAAFRAHWAGQGGA